jgi:hypothetical protein
MFGNPLFYYAKKRIDVWFLKIFFETIKEPFVETVYGELKIFAPYGVITDLPSGHLSSENSLLITVQLKIHLFINKTNGTINREIICY